MELNFASLSDVGNVRKNNEDFVFAGKLNDGEHLFIVADGMGGHQAGEVASYRAVTTLVKLVKRGINGDVPETLTRMLLEINELLFREGKSSHSGKGMGTTLSVLYIRGDRGYIAHVGDSRVYRLSLHGLEQLTEDHSLVGKLLKDGFITPEEAQNHPKRNVLYQSIGLKQRVDIQATGPFPVRVGEKFLLCSDGLNNELVDRQLEEFLKMRSPRRIAEQLLRRAKGGVASDNISVVTVSVDTELDEENTLVEDTAKLTIPVQVRKKQNRRYGIFALLGFLLLLLLALLFYLVMDLKKDADADADSYANAVADTGRMRIAQIVGTPGCGPPIAHTRVKPGPRGES